MKKSPIFLLLLALAHPSLAAGSDTGFSQKFGLRFQGAPTPILPIIAPSRALDILHRWNEIAINATGLDHTPVPPGDPRVFGEQLGPGRSSRALAIVHIAVFDAVNAVVGGFQSYTRLRAASQDASVEAAIALTALFPSQKADFDAELVEDLSALRDGRAKANGVTLGRAAAAAILARRAND